MCNDFGNHVPYSAYVEAFSQTRLPLIVPDAIPNLEPRDDIWPTETAPILRRAEGGVELAQVRWGFAPGRPKAGPVINFRSEGRRFPRGRCLVPASHFYEFTGAKPPKSKWRFTKAGEDWFCFAGLWRPGAAETPDAFTLLTTTPGPAWHRSTTGKWWCWSARTGWRGWISRGLKASCCVPCPLVASPSSKCDSVLVAPLPCPAGHADRCLWMA